MRRSAWAIAVGVGAALVATLAVAVRSRLVPLGVRGEWEWARVTTPLEPWSVAFAGLALAGYATFAAIGHRSLARGRAAWPWLVGLVPASVLVQAGIQDGAPIGHGLAKWALALSNRGSSGYYHVAKEQIPDLGRFLAAYPAWVAEGDALHIGTHPPGLLVTSWAGLRAFEARPGMARAVVGALPESVAMAFRSMEARPLPVADRAALATTGAAILVLSALTCLPVYALARSRLTPSGSWAAAVLWPLTTSALMFQPAADAAFPILSATALALAVGSGRAAWLAGLAGVGLGVGTQFTLAFFPVGLIVGLALSLDRSVRPAGRALRIGLTGVGFVATTLLVWGLTSASPPAIWARNAANHARFYREYPRSYLAWVAENPVELAVGLGLPTAVWMVVGLGRRTGLAGITLAILAVLTLSGKNLSEVGRLWLPLMPPLVVAAGAGVERLGTPPVGLGLTLAALGLQALLLQSLIQVVYPT